jgi:hypothetical protein
LSQSEAIRTPNKITAANARFRLPFWFRGSRHPLSAVEFNCWQHRSLKTEAKTSFWRAAVVAASLLAPHLWFCYLFRKTGAATGWLGNVVGVVSS